jgi:hypothetical protein
VWQTLPYIAVHVIAPVAAAVKVTVWFAGCMVIVEGALLTDIKDLVCRANAGVLLEVCARCSRGADNIQAPIGHVGGKDFVTAG